jgi:hypothetical protein
MNTLLSIEQAAELVKSGTPLCLAGSEASLDRLPRGNWIAGTIPYFMAKDGGVKADDRVFATSFPADQTPAFAYYTPETLPLVTENTPSSGYAVAIIPAGGVAHRRFAEESRDFESAFLKPTIGWISGVDVADLGKITPKVYDGRTGTKYEDGAVVAHVTLPESQLATIEIVNIFEPDGGDVLRFEETGFAATRCLVNGRSEDLAGYLERRGNSDGRLPLVGDFAGAELNVSVQSIDASSGVVKFYAPVFPGVDYRLARAVTDYGARFDEQMRTSSPTGIVFSCNCILNYLYGGLEGRKVGELEGPITFGEIGYQLLNQTLVMLRVQ